MSEFKKATQEIKESLDIEEELKEAKEDLVDSVSGLDTPLELESAQSEESKAPKYEDYDEMLEDYEKAKSQPPSDDTAVKEERKAKEKDQDG
jgi:hypothetical protein